MPAHGRVTICAEPGDGDVRLSVGNDGDPIPTEIGKRIFDPFFTTRGTGTGLGLALVRRIVEEVGGRVVLDPTDQGVSFACWQPIERERERRRAEPPPSQR